MALNRVQQKQEYARKCSHREAARGSNMENLSEWFSTRLSSSALDFAWAAGQVPADRQNKQPPRGLGEWSAARHIFHLGYYEQTIALPGMQQWLGRPMIEPKDDEDSAWQGNELVDDLLRRFQEIRDQQIALLPGLKETDWGVVCETIWGPQTLAWVVTKTYQHTAEHISDVLRIALFWDHYAEKAILT